MQETIFPTLFVDKRWLYQKAKGTVTGQYTSQVKHEIDFFLTYTVYDFRSP